MLSRLDKVKDVNDILYGACPENRYAMRLKVIESNKKNVNFIVRFLRWIGSIDWVYWFFAFLSSTCVCVFLVGLGLAFETPDNQQYTCTKTDKNGKIEMVCRKTDDDSYTVMPVIMPVIIR